MKALRTLTCGLLLGAALSVQAAPAHPAPARNAQADHAISLVAWRDWSEAVFAEARATHKYVLLDVGAVWCHWCHVMDATTYRDPAVLALIGKYFIPVRVDQDARPDLSRRYEDFGWPATIVLDGEGRDIGKMRGYREPERFAARLEAILADPSPLHAIEDEDRDRVFAQGSRLTDGVRDELEKRWREALDTNIGGVRQAQRFLTHDPVAYGLARAGRGDRDAERWVRLTLAQARALIDPVWGGMYQYSTHGDWQHPHYEKIMETQAVAMRLYAQAYRTWGERAHLEAAQAIHGYVKKFLADQRGAFYTSQDADAVPGVQGDAYFALDDAQRRALATPRIDRHIYARENGWMIEALVELYGASGDPQVLAEALRAARWIVRHRGNADGSFRHDATDRGGPYFGDNLAMGRAVLALYSATGDRQWLLRARRVAASFHRFAASNGGGYLPTAPRAVSKLAARANIDENIEAARFANLLFRYSGDPRDASLSDVAIRYITNEDVALRYGMLPGALLATLEASEDPLHITLVGGKRDPRSQLLYVAALRQGGGYRRIEWWDKAEGALFNPDVSYPALDRPAAFVCTDRTCSLPITDTEDIGRYLMLP